MTDNIITMPTPLNVLSERIGDAKTRADKSREDWFQATLDLIAALSEARARYNNDLEFSIWLVSEGHDDIGKDDRAALIAMATCMDLTRIVLSETNRSSWQMIWREEIKPRVRSATKPLLSVPVSPETDVAATTEPLASLPAPSQVEEKTVTEKPRHSIVSSAGKTAKDINRAELVKRLGISVEDYSDLFAAYPPHRQQALKREFIKALDDKPKKNKQPAIDLFMLGLAIARSGKVVHLSDRAAFDARIFLPDIPEAISKFITFEKLLDRVALLSPMNDKAVVLKSTTANAAEIYDQLSHFWEHGKDKPKIERKIEISPTDSKAKIKHQVTFCGEIIWPRPELAHVTYDDLNAGWHIIDYWAQHLAVATPRRPKEVAVQMRHLIQDIAKATSIAALTDVMLMMVSAYSKINEGREVGNLAPKMPPGLAR